MIGALVGAAAGLASSIWGGIKARKAAQKAEAQLAQQKQDNENWYRRRYNQDETQTAEAQAMITRAREEAMRQLQAARGQQAVMGGTGEGVAQAQEAANRLVSDTLTGVAAQGTARKDAVESQYLQTKNNIGQQYYNLYQQQAGNATNAANAGMQAGMGLVGADMSAHLQTGRGLFGAMFGKNKTVTGGA